MSPRRVLVVDDEDHIREVAQVSLESLAVWEVIEAGSGHRAVELAARERPEAILLDVMMPDMDGIATFEKLQTDDSTRDVPVVFLTASVQSADRARLEGLGAVGILPKPFDPLTLAESVAGLLGWTL